MRQYITENEYKELLGVQETPSNFNILVIEASEYINHRTFNRIDANFNLNEKIKFATALIIEKTNIADEKIKNMGNLKSQNIAGWSESYATPEEIKKDLETDKNEIITKYLWNVIGKDGQPLLYCGVK